MLGSNLGVLSCFPRLLALKQEKQTNGVYTTHFVLTSLFAMGVLSSPGRCCSRARTTQLAVMVARIMYSNGVWATKLRKAPLL